MKTKLLFLLAVVLLASACAKKGMRISVRRPAPIYVPNSLQKIVLVNRSEGNNTSALEGILSGELPNQDKGLSGECMRGISEELGKSTRFKVLMHDKRLKAPSPMSVQFGELLAWDYIDSLCEAYKVDAVLTIEFFDSDFTITNVAPNVTMNPTTGLPNIASLMSVSVNGRANASAGFRLYQAKEHKLIYEAPYRYGYNWSASAANPIDAAAKLMGRNDALRQTSYNTGAAFAAQLIPLYYWEDRQMYRSKKGEMAQAMRLGLTNNWTEAARVWENYYNNNSTSLKDKAKAAYNLALSYEILEDLTLAKQWISKSYIDSGKAATLRYSELLERRLRNQRQEEQRTNRQE